MMDRWGDDGRRTMRDLNTALDFLAQLHLKNSYNVALLKIFLCYIVIYFFHEYLHRDKELVIAQRCYSPRRCPRCDQRRLRRNPFFLQTSSLIQILWVALFSWVPIFVHVTKMAHSWGSEFVVIVFSFIIHKENHHFVGTGIRGSDSHENWIHCNDLKSCAVFVFLN